MYVFNILSPTAPEPRFASRARVAIVAAAAGLAVTAAGCGGGLSPAAPSASLSAPLPVAPSGATTFSKHYIEALFLGTGPFSAADGAYGCPYFPGRWSGFPAGTAVELLVSTSIGADNAAAMNQASGGVATATGGRLTAHIRDTVEVNPLPAPSQVAVTAHAEPTTLGCLFWQGCTMFDFNPPPVIASARAVLYPSQTTNAYVHDAIGHGVLGLCHVDARRIGGADRSLMAFGPEVYSDMIAPQLTTLDLDAIRAVFSSGLSVGATRTDFVRVGLIEPGAATTLQSPGALPQVPAGIGAVPVRP